MLKNTCVYHIFSTPKDTYEFYVKLTAESCYLAAHFYQVKNGQFECYHAQSNFCEFADAFENSITLNKSEQYSTNIEEVEFDKIVKLRFGCKDNFTFFI